MLQIDQIINHELFQKCLQKNNDAEQNRKFCRHGLTHFLDVARIAWILNLEEQVGISKELIYGTALLHDLGRFVQYQDGTPHEIASREIASHILKDCDYDEGEREQILEAISSHRDASCKEGNNLKGIIYRADKLSRTCFGCDAEAECNWKGDKKNHFLLY